MFFLGGLGGSILIFQPVAMMCQGSKNEALYVLIAAIFGFLLFGILSIYFFRSIVIVSTSIIGSFYFMVGIFTLMENSPGSTRFVQWVDPSDKGFFFFLLIAVIGILIQHGINKMYPEPEDKPDQKGGKPKEQGMGGT
jgi:hypothetical protein